MTISIVTKVTTPIGSASGTTLDLNSTTSFDYSLYQFPTTENADYTSKNHYVIFYINTPATSAWNTGSQNSPSPVMNRGNTNATNFGLRDASQQSSAGTGVSSGLVSTIVNQVLSSKTVRTSAAIALYIPNTMVFGQHMQYENVSLTEAMQVAGVNLADLGAVAGGLSAGKTGVAGAAAASLISDFVKKWTGHGSSADKAILAGLGLADNPQNFLLFKQIDFRKFQFDFLLTPETADEASVIQKIIYLFRLNAAPEVATGSTGRFFIPPSEFDIDIGHNGQRNTTLPKISTCVLNDITVDYAAGGQWNTYYDGQPLQTRMTLNFTEKVILTKDLVSTGF